MRTEFKASFLKSVKKIKSAQLKEGIADTIFRVEAAAGINNIANLKKLKGY